MSPAFRRLTSIALGALLGIGAVTTAAGPASAGNIWRIKTAPSPSTGQPIEGGGSWIVNKASGYYLGRSMVGWTFDVVSTSPSNWHYGRAIDGINMCGWAMPGSMDAQVGSQGDSCSAATREEMSHRMSFGKDYNARPHEATTGSPAAADTSCTVYYNYFYGTDWSSNGGHWAQPAGPASSSVLYRFTTHDNGAVVVRDPVYGWGFLPFNCVTRPSFLNNEDD